MRAKKVPRGQPWYPERRDPFKHAEELRARALRVRTVDAYTNAALAAVTAAKETVSEASKATYRQDAERFTKLAEEATKYEAGTAFGNMKWDRVYDFARERMARDGEVYLGALRDKCNEVGITNFSEQSELIASIGDERHWKLREYRFVL